MCEKFTTNRFTLKQGHMQSALKQTEDRVCDDFCFINSIFDIENIK